MSLSHSPSIVRDGLVLYLDAANPKSYPGSGTTWFDLSGNSNNGTLTNSPTHSSQFNGEISFNGTSYVDVPSPNLSSTNFTVIGASRYIGATQQRIITSKANNWLLGHWGARSEVYFSNGWVKQTGGAPDFVWRLYAGTGNISEDKYSFWVNENKLISDSTAGASGPNGFALGRWQGTSEGSTGQVGFVLAYSRVLLDNEIKQNFNALRGRYGI
jgi:hypothetical protein